MMMTTIPDDDSDEEWGRIADAVNIFEKQYIAARNSTLPSQSVPTTTPAAAATSFTAPVSHHPRVPSPFASAPAAPPQQHPQLSSAVPASSNARGPARQQQQQQPSPFVTTTTTTSSPSQQSQSQSMMHPGKCGHLSSSATAAAAALPPLPPSSSTTRIDPSTSTPVAPASVHVSGASGLVVPAPAATNDCNGSDSDHCNANDSIINDEHPATTTNTTGPVALSREPNNDQSFYSRVLAQKDDQLVQLQQELTGMQATYRNKVRVLENALSSTTHNTHTAHRIKQLEAEVDKYRTEAHAMRVQDRAHSEDLSFMRQELVRFRDREKKLLAKLALRESVNNSNNQNKNHIIVSQTQHPPVVQGEDDDDENRHDGGNMNGGGGNNDHHQDTLPPVVPALTQPGDVVEPTQLMHTQFMSQTQSQMPTQTQYAATAAAGPATVNGGVHQTLPTSSQRPSGVVPGGGGGTQAGGASDMRAPRPPSRRRRRATLHGRNGLVPGGVTSRRRATVAGGAGGGGMNGTQSRKRNYANTNNGANSLQQQQHPLAAAANGYADYDIPGTSPGVGAGGGGGGGMGGPAKWSSDRYGGAVELSSCSSTDLWADTTLRGRLFGGRLGQMLFSLASSVSPTSAFNSTGITSRSSASSIPPTSTFPPDSAPPIMPNNNDTNTNNRSSSSNTIPPHKSSTVISSSLASLSLSDTQQRHQHLTRALLYGAAGGEDSRWPQLLSALTGPILDSSPLVALRAAHVILSYSSAARLSCCCAVPASQPVAQQQSCAPFASQTFALLVRATEMSDTRVAAACLRVLQAVVAAVGDARDAGAAHEVSDKVCRLVAKQKMHVDAVFAWASYSSSMVMSPSSAVMAPSHVAHGGGVSGGVGPPNGTGNSNNNANGQVQGRNGGDGSSFDGVAAASGRCTAAAATGSAAVRNVFAVSNVHNSVGPGGGVGGGGGGGYVPGQVMMNIDLNCDTHGHEFSKRAALRRRCLTKARTKRQQQRQKNQARKPHLTSAAQQNVDTSNSNNENVNMNMNIKAADPMVVDSVVGHKDDTRLHRAKVWDENNVIDDDEDEDEDDNDNFLDEYDIDDGDVDDDMAQCDGILPLLHSGVVCGGGAVPGNASGGLVVQVADGATATAAAVGGAAEGVGRTSALPSLTSMSPAVAAATTAMSTASSTSVQCEALQLIEAVTGLLMERDRNHHHLVCQQNEKRKQHVPSSSPSPSNSGTGDKGKATGDNDNEGDGDKDGDDSSVDAMWAFVERGYDVVCDVLLHGARDDASIEAALGMLALAAMYAPYLITDYGGIDGVCAMLARLFWWLQHTDEGHVSGGGGDFNSSIGCCWDRQTVVAMLKACVHVLVLVAPALNASRNKIDVNGPVRLTGLGVLAALAWPRQGLGATPAEFVMQDDDDLGDGGVDEGTGNGNADANDEEAKKFASDGNDVGGDKADEDAGQKQQQRQQNKNKNKKNKVNDRNGGPDVGGFGSQFVQDCQKAWTLLYRRTKNK